MPAPKTHTAHSVNVAHKSKKISEMLIVLVCVLLILSMGIFINQIYDTQYLSADIGNSYSYSNFGLPPAVKVVNNPVFQQVTAPTGQVVSGFPTALTPVNGQITSSYQNQYNGYNQYTLNLTAKVPITAEYLAMQKLISKAKFTISQKIATADLYTINAKQANSYVTVQLMPVNSSDIAITINYGNPVNNY